MTRKLCKTELMNCFLKVYKPTFRGRFIFFCKKETTFRNCSAERTNEGRRGQIETLLYNENTNVGK